MPKTIQKRNLSKILKPFENKWVAIMPDYKRIAASGDTLEDTFSKVKEDERRKVVFHRVQPPGIFYEPATL